MKSIYKIQLFFLLVFCFTNCASAELFSNKSAEFDKQISRVYVVLGGHKDSGYFLKSLRYYLHNDLKENQVVSKFFIPSALALSNDKTYKNEVTAFKPDMVLFIDATNVGSSQRTTMNMGYPNTMSSPHPDWAELDLQMSKPEETDLLWRGQLTVSGNLFSDKPGKKASKTIIKQLISDGVIRDVNN